MSNAKLKGLAATAEDLYRRVQEAEALLAQAEETRDELGALEVAKALGEDVDTKRITELTKLQTTATATARQIGPLRERWEEAVEAWRQVALTQLEGEKELAEVRAESDRLTAEIKGLMEQADGLRGRKDLLRNAVNARRAWLTQHRGRPDILMQRVGGA